jgi:hypothetical protein
LKYGTTRDYTIELLCNLERAKKVQAIFCVCRGGVKERRAEALLRIIGPNFRVVLRLRDGVVAEAARPVSYMKGWRVERVLALAARWGWKAEMSSAEEAQVAQAPRSPRPAP